MSCLDLGFGRGHCRLRRHVVLDSVVQVLLAGGLLFRQRSVAVDIKFGPALHRLSVGKRGLRLRQLPFGLIERRLKGARVDLEQQLPLSDKCAFLVALSLQVARDLCSDIGIGESVERADPLAKNGDVLLLNLHDFDVRSAARLSARYMLWPHRSYGHADDGQAKPSAYPEFAFRTRIHRLLRQGNYSPGQSFPVPSPVGWIS